MTPGATDGIPLIIHQIWNDREIPRDVYRQEWTDSWRIHHPDWLYVLWTGDALLRLAQARYPEFEHFVSSHVSPVVRADYGRLMVLCHWGGLYVDLDYICLKSIDGLLRERRCVVPEVRPGCVTNSLIAAVPGHPVLRAALQEAVSRGTRLNDKPVQWVCGPRLLQDVVDRHAGADIWIAPPHLLCPADWERGYGLRRGVAEEIVSNPGSVWPDAHAVTFWAHHW
jgi:mannosyltransferase OCH1-like enzyme